MPHKDERLYYGKPEGEPLEDVIRHMLRDWCPEPIDLHVTEPTGTWVMPFEVPDPPTTVLEAIQRCAEVAGWAGWDIMMVVDRLTLRPREWPDLDAHDFENRLTISPTDTGGNDGA